jgi:hypothetical protein
MDSLIPNLNVTSQYLRDKYGTALAGLKGKVQGRTL